MSSLTNRPKGDLVLDLLLRALRFHDEQLNALAVELIGRCGEAPLRRLVQEATDRKNRPAHRVRVLQAIRRIGRVTDLASYLDLSVLTRDKNPGIRSAVAQLLGDLGQTQAEFAEGPRLPLSPLADELPPGKRRRACIQTSGGRPG